ncbi:MAG: SPFH and helix-turn-helix domain-containing protein [Parvibaculaceae bacterium]
MLDIPERPEPMVPSAHDAELAREASRTLAAKAEAELKVHLEDGAEVVLPKSAARLLQYLLTEMAHGNAVTIFPLHAELTTQEAADFLNVSRPYLITLLQRHELPFHKVGTHRRIKFSDLRDFRSRRESERKAAMQELAHQAQEKGMGY